MEVAKMARQETMITQMEMVTNSKLLQFQNTLMVELSSAESRDDDDNNVIFPGKSDKSEATSRLDHLAERSFPEGISNKVDGTSQKVGNTEEIDSLFKNIQLTSEDPSESFNVSKKPKSTSPNSPFLTNTAKVQMLLNKYARSHEENRRLREARGLPCAHDIINPSDVSILNFEYLVAEADQHTSKDLVGDDRQKILEQAHELQSIIHCYKRLKEENKTLTLSHVEMETLVTTVKEEAPEYHRKTEHTPVQNKISDELLNHKQSSLLKTENHVEMGEATENQNLEVETAETAETVVLLTSPIAAQQSSRSGGRGETFYSNSDGEQGSLGTSYYSTKSLSSKSPKLQTALEGLHKAKIINDKFAEENDLLKKKVMLLEARETCTETANKTLTIETAGAYALLTSPMAAEESNKSESGKNIFFSKNDGERRSPGTPNSGRSLGSKNSKVQMALEGLNKAKIINDKFAEENDLLKKRLIFLEARESELRSQLESKERSNIELSSQVNQLSKSLDTERKSFKQIVSNKAVEKSVDPSISLDLKGRFPSEVDNSAIISTLSESRDVHNITQWMDEVQEESQRLISAFEKVQLEKKELELLYQKSIEALNAKSKDLEGAVSRNEHNANIDERMKELEDLLLAERQEIEKLRKALSDKSKDLEGAVSRNEHNANIDERMKELEDLLFAERQEIEKLRKALSAKSKDLEGAVSRNERNANIDERMKELEDLLLVERQDIGKLRKEKNDLEVLHKRACDEINLKESDLKIMEDRCSNYARELKESKYHTNVLECTVTDLEGRVIELKSQNDQLRRDNIEQEKRANSIASSLETSEYRVRILERSVADLEEREVEQKSYYKEIANQNFHMCQEMEQLIKKVNSTHRSYAESRNEVTALQNAINLIKSSHQKHIEELECETNVLHEDKNITATQLNEVSKQLQVKSQELKECQDSLAVLHEDKKCVVAQLNDISKQLRMKTQQLKKCENSLPLVLKDLEVEKQLLRELQTSFSSEMKKRQMEFLKIGGAIRERAHESFELKDHEIRQLREELKNERQKVGEMKALFKKRSAERKAEFLERENSLRQRMNEIIESKNRQIGSLEEDVDRILGLASLTEQNEGYLKKELSDAEEKLREAKNALESEGGRRNGVHKALGEFEEQINQVIERLGHVFQIEEDLGGDEKAVASFVSEIDEMLQKIESATRLMSKVVLKLDVAYPESQMLGQSERELPNENGELTTRVQEMSGILEKAADKVNEQQMLLDTLVEENGGLKARLATALAQEEQVVFLSETLNAISEEKKSIEQKHFKCMEELELLQTNLSAERSTISKLQGEIDELINSRHEMESHFNKMLEDAVASSSDLRENIELLEKERALWTSVNAQTEREVAETSALKAQLKEAYSRLSEAHTRLEDSLVVAREERQQNKQLSADHDNLKESTRRQIDEMNVVIAELRKQLEDALVKNEEQKTKMEMQRLKEAESNRRQVNQLEEEHSKQLKRQLEETLTKNEEFNQAAVRFENEILALQEELSQACAEKQKLMDDLKTAMLKLNEVDDRELEEENKRLQKNLVIATTRIGSLEDEARKSKELFDLALSALRAENDKLAEDLRDAEIRIRHFERMTDPSGKVQKLTEEINQLKVKYRQSMDALHKQTVQSGIEADGKKQYSEKNRRLEEMLAESFNTIEKQRVDVTSLRTRVAALENELASLKVHSENGKSSDLQQDEKDKLEQQLSVQEKDLQVILGDFKRCKARNLQFRDQINTLRDRLFDAEKVKDRVIAQDNLISNLQRDKEEMEQQIETMRRQLKDHQTRKKALEHELTENTNLLLVIKDKLKAQNQK